MRDAGFGEAADTTRSGTAPQAFVAYRTPALSLLHHWRHCNLTAARQDDARHPAALFHRQHAAPVGR